MNRFRLGKSNYFVTRDTPSVSIYSELIQEFTSQNPLQLIILKRFRCLLHSHPIKIN